MIMSRFRRRVASSTAAASPGQQQPPGDGSQTGSSRRRHAIFYDVENTSSPDDVSHVAALLEMDRARSDTQLVAVGNWRVIGQATARLLAQQGAELVHSAPNTGVRDWSDLRIAVDAGIWLGSAKPGDMLDVVSDDQAFDAVGDVAAALGVQFRRIPARERVVSERVRPPRTRSRPAEVERAGKQASHDDILAFVRRLMAKDSPGQGSVTLDALSNALKDAGFVRAPGSYRLITRLRRVKELRVSADGVIRFASPEDAGEPAEASVATDAPKPRRRRGRRGGRRRSGRARGESTDGAALELEEAPPDVAS